MSVLSKFFQLRKTNASLFWFIIIITLGLIFIILILIGVIVYIASLLKVHKTNVGVECNTLIDLAIKIKKIAKDDITHELVDEYKKEIKKCLNHFSFEVKAFNKRFPNKDVIKSKSLHWKSLIDEHTKYHKFYHIIHEIFDDINPIILQRFSNTKFGLEKMESIKKTLDKIDEYISVKEGEGKGEGEGEGEVEE